MARKVEEELELRSNRGPGLLVGAISVLGSQGLGV